MGYFLLHELLPVIMNMTITGSIVIVLVLLARLALRRAPRICSYALWLVVLFRLLCPVTISAPVSLMGLLDTPVTEVTAHTSAAAYVPRDVVHDPTPTVELPVPGVGEAVTDALPQGEEQTAADPLEAPVAIATLVWMAGAAAMVIYGAVSLVRLRRRLVGAVPLEKGVYLADHIDTPFVLGLFRPKIYLPSALPEGERGYILLHERHHIRRLDHAVKLLAFLALCVHWFNPLVWLMFVLLGRDMEMSCDEAVMKKLGEAVRADYSASLLRLATGQKLIAGAPLAFGEGDTRDRVKNVLKWKRPRLWAVLAGAAVCAVVIAVCAVNPKASGLDTGFHLRISPALENWLADNIDDPVHLPAKWEADDDGNAILLEPLTIADVYGSHSVFVPVPEGFIKHFEQFEQEGTVPDLREIDHSEGYGEYWDNSDLSLRLLYADADQDIFAWGFRDDQYQYYGLVIDSGEEQSLSYFPYQYTNNRAITPDFFLDESGSILTMICHIGGGSGISVDNAYVFTLDCDPIQPFTVDLETLCKEMNERVKLTYSKPLNCAEVSIDGAAPVSYELTCFGVPKDTQLVPTQSFWGNHIDFAVHEDSLLVSFAPTLFSDQYPGAMFYLLGEPEFTTQIVFSFSDNGKIKDFTLDMIKNS